VVGYELLESSAGEAEEAIREWGFDPTELSTGGETECLFCRAAVLAKYVRECGITNRIGLQLTAVVANGSGLPVRRFTATTDPCLSSIPRCPSTLTRSPPRIRC